jgi:hypothetical protein
LWCPRIVDSTRSAQDALREGFMAISNLLDIDSILDMPVSNLVMFDPSRRAPPLGLPLNRSSDLGKAIFAATRGQTRLNKDCSLWFANSCLTSVQVRSAQWDWRPFDRLPFSLSKPNAKNNVSFDLVPGYWEESTLFGGAHF